MKDTVQKITITFTGNIEEEFYNYLIQEMYLFKKEYNDINIHVCDEYEDGSQFNMLIRDV